MATEPTPNVEEIDPYKFNWNDANAYAAVGVGAPDDPGLADLPDDTLNADENATPATSQPAQATPAASPAAAPASAPAPTTQPAANAPAPSSSAPSPAANAGNQNDQPDGVLTRDGKRVIPFAVLHDVREENQRLKQQLAERNAAAPTPAAAPAPTPAAAPPAPAPRTTAPAPAANELNDEFIEELEADFPAAGRLARATRATAEALAAQQARAIEEAQARELVLVNQAIEAHPTLQAWQDAAGKEWARARQLDALLSEQDQDYAAMSYDERFARVERMVAAEFGQQVAAPTRSAAPPPAPAAPAAGPSTPPTLPAARPAPVPTLSDLGGTAPRSADDEIMSSSPLDLLAKAERMSDADLRRFGGLGY